MSVIQPLSALNVYYFIKCYQKEILDYFERHHDFSIRYHKKNTNLYYKKMVGNMAQYFQKKSISNGQRAVEQTGNYFKIGPFESINSFSDSRTWRMCNFKYKYYAKFDYKSCFDSIYTHAFTWIIEKNVIDSKKAANSNLFITIDRVLQNINSRYSNGIVVGPEFSRMMAEILLQHIDSEICLSLSRENIHKNTDYVVFRYVDDIFVFSNQEQIIEKILSKFQTVGERYLLRLNDLKMEKGLTPCLPKGWLDKTRQIADTIGAFFYKYKRSDYDKLPEDKKHIVSDEYISIDRLKDEVAVLIKEYPSSKRTIVSFLLSTLLKNISKKNDDYTLFGKNGLGKSLLLLDMSLYIYAFYPSFEQTRKIISIISYMNEEINFKKDSMAHNRFHDIIKRYSFIFTTGNIFDLCDWLPLLREYNIMLDTNVEDFLIKEAEEKNNPIIWGNILMYSKIYNPFFKSVQAKVSDIVQSQIDKLSENNEMMQSEFWYVLIFHNCQYLVEKTKKKIEEIINRIATKADKEFPTHKSIRLVCKFLMWKSEGGSKPEKSFFDWSDESSFAGQVTYRTYQRTIFRNYRRNKNWLYASLD